MCGIAKDFPILFPLLIPFPELSDLISHKIEFLSGMDHHIEIKCARLRKFTGILSVHLLQDGRLTVHDLIVRQSKQIPLIIKIIHRKSELTGKIGATDGRGLEIRKRIVHPTHIPFIIKSKTALSDGFGDIRVVGGIFCNKHDAPITAAQPPVHSSDEFHRGAVHATPFISLPVDHPTDRIHPKSVKMIDVQPKITRYLRVKLRTSPRE